jgi:hypothetical protein
MSYRDWVRGTIKASAYASGNMVHLIAGTKVALNNLRGEGELDEDNDNEARS